MATAANVTEMLFFLSLERMQLGRVYSLETKEAAEALAFHRFHHLICRVDPAMGTSGN